MKRLKKFWAVLLCVFVFTAMLVPVVSAEVLVDPAKKGSIRLTKYNLPAGVAAGMSNKGNETTGTAAGVPAEATPLDGIYFNYTKVKVDNSATGAAILHTDAQGNKYIADTSGSTKTGRAATAVTTGQINWTNLDQGIYLIKEEADARVPVPVDDFLISIPTTIHNTTGDDTLIYDVYVYPKNTTMGVEKKVLEGSTPVTGMAVKPGDVVTWEITGSVPQDVYSTNMTEDNKIKFMITDNFDKYLSANINSCTEVAYYNAAGTKTVMTKGTDYAIGYKTAATAGISTTDFSGQLTITFTQVGRMRLSTNKAAKVKATITTTVLDGAPSIKIDNQAYLNFTNKDGTVFDKQPPTNPYVYYGGIKIVKKDAKTGALLAGASFKISTTNPATTTTFMKDPTNASKDWVVTTSLPGGDAFFSGLKYGLTGETDPITATGTKYWLVEVNAPDGYKLVGNPIEVTVNYQSANNGYVVKEVLNTKGFTLPATGGNGTIVFTVIGFTIIGAAVIMLIAARKKKAESE